MKYVVITGGVMSGVGKGITASSIGRILKESQLRVTAVKIDPYLNFDAGTMSPYEHGEVFVLDDGGEVDLDLGNYERFLDITLTKDHNITGGKIYQHVLNLERQGAYLGKTVQMVPHVTDAIKNWIVQVAQKQVDDSNKAPEICIIELGGSVGDMESVVFVEALRRLRFDVGAENFYLVHVSYVPTVGKEMKSKPAQHSVKTLREAGLIPNIIVCRSNQPITAEVRSKISLCSMISPTHVLSVHDVSNIYAVPRLLLQQNIGSLLLNDMRINCTPPLQIKEFDMLDYKIEHCSKEVTIGIVGKYTNFSDCYMSLVKALSSAALALDLKLKIVWIESTDLELELKTELNSDIISKACLVKNGDVESQEKPNPNEIARECTDKNTITTDKNFKKSDDGQASKDESNNSENKNIKTASKNVWKQLESVDGILIPGGFGDRGVEGKIRAIEYARINGKPFFGICLGMQCAVIEYARHVCHLNQANSAEFDPSSEHKVVIFMPEISPSQMGGTMRLGGRICCLQKNTVAYQCYQSSEIRERHRHRYEVNPDYVEKLESKGLHFSGRDELGVRMEILELPANKHPFFFACQFHPEFKSGPTRPSPPFLGFIQASIKNRDKENSSMEKNGMERKENCSTGSELKSTQNK